jgi:hypothetical protein
MDFLAFFSLANLKRFWLPLFVLCLIVSVFFSGIFLAIYRKVRAVVPGAAAITPAK